ncbi:unnamed protein product [Heligmosomoides polygyrus]|uniref:Reverse transcriptase domain-containing protein n=1 Tax=Heligmosomoides polygyrus TaxID=6339 RepID=A0A183FP57_HELPZ|nr:unnamed protein product [Heligmosomoides polygyrus]
MLASGDKDELEREVQAWCDRMERFGLKLNVKKTEYLTTDVNESGSIKTALSLHALRLVQVALVDWRALRQEDTRALKSKIYRAVIRPVAIRPAQHFRLSVMETKMLRWTAGVTRMDRIRNNIIRQKFGVAPIANKMREARLR